MQKPWVPWGLHTGWMMDSHWERPVWRGPLALRQEGMEEASWGTEGGEAGRGGKERQAWAGRGADCRARSQAPREGWALTQFILLSEKQRADKDTEESWVALDAAEGAHTRRPPFLGVGSRKGSGKGDTERPVMSTVGKACLCAGLCTPWGRSQSGCFFWTHTTHTTQWQQTWLTFVYFISFFPPRQWSMKPYGNPTAQLPESRLGLPGARDSPKLIKCCAPRIN